MKKILLFILISGTALAQIQTGDIQNFWSVSYIDWQPAAAQHVITAECKAVGEYCYIFLDQEIEGQIAQSRIDDLCSIFDSDFGPVLPQLYGPAPDQFDNDPKIYILIQDDEGWAGYFDPANQMPASFVDSVWGKNNNEKEIIYITEYAFDQGMEAWVVSHEYGHMIHWARDHSPEPPSNPSTYWEEAWIDEGFAMFSSVYLTEDITQQNVTDIPYFINNPNLPLIYFIDNNCYSLVKIWMTFMYQHYGAEDFITTLINEQANGLDGLISTITSLGYSESVEEIFEHFVVANYIDNKNFAGGKYSHYHYSFSKPAVKFEHNTYPASGASPGLYSYAAEYIKFNAAGESPITINFTADEDKKFRLAFIKLNYYNPVEVEFIQPQGASSAVYTADDFGAGYNNIVMAVICVDSSLTQSEKAGYSYSAEVAPSGIAAEESAPRQFRLDQNFPNPFNPSTTISWYQPERSFVNITVYNSNGREAAILVNGEKDAGEHSIRWNPAGLGSGVYFYKITAGSRSVIKKCILLK